VGAPGSPDPSGGVGAAPATAVMRCAKCKAASVERLPPNQFSRNPGYVCSACGAKMRPPGSITGYVFATILGAFVALFGLFAAAAGITAEAAANYRGRVLVGAVTMVGLGAVVAGWAGRQLLLPVPLDAPARPSRLLFAIAVLLSVIVVGLLIIGGCLFGFMHYLHEMM
jgi:hypothetical protein